MREIFQSSIERLLADLAKPEMVRGYEAEVWSHTLWSALEASGFGLAGAPETMGGADASWGDLYGVMVACGRFSLPSPLPETLLANWLLGHVGLAALDGSLSFAANAELTLLNGKVSGTLLDVPWGRYVEHVVAITDDDQPALVLLSTPEAATVNRRLNIAGEPRDDLRFSHQSVVACACLPTTMPSDVLLLGGAMLRSAQIAGAMQATLELTAAYAGERVQFGKAIANFQAIQHQIAILAEHTAAALVASEAAFEESEGALAVLQIMTAKAIAAEAAGIAAGIAHAVHGAIGFTHEHPLHLLTRRLWSWRSEFGSASFWSQRLGRAICRGGAAALWPTVTRGDFSPQGKESR